MSCFNPNFEIQNKHVSLLSPTTQRVITNFLKRSSKGNIISIESIKYRKIELVSTVDFVPKVLTELILECRCRDSYGFPGMNKLPENMYSTLKSILKDFSGVKLEYHYSMYCSRD
jgi:hypothetical protein